MIPRVLLCLSALLVATPAFAQGRDDQVLKTGRRNRSVPEVILFYVPNRVFDVLDIVRLRARVGPGVAARVRATEGLDVGLGSYAAVFAGLPGPREEVELPLPLGFESYAGIEVGADAAVSSPNDPEYTETEFGVSIQALLAGVDIGVDPIEVVDVVTGLALIDLRGDDF
jgi:hypothetical protein